MHCIIKTNEQYPWDGTVPLIVYIITSGVNECLALPCMIFQSSLDYSSVCLECNGANFHYLQHIYYIIFRVRSIVLNKSLVLEVVISNQHCRTQTTWMMIQSYFIANLYILFKLRVPQFLLKYRKLSDRRLPPTHPSPNYDPTNSEQKLVCGDWHPSENPNHPTPFIFEKMKSLGCLVLVSI